MMTIASAVALTACGGGGGGGSTPAATAPVAATVSFPFQSAYKAFVANGYSKGFSISGSCAGSGNLSMASAKASTFEGVNGFASAQTMTLNYTNCTPASAASTSTSYFDTNYNPLGSDSGGSGYSVYAAPVVLPTTVTVGATGVVGTQNSYTTSTKATRDGYATVSYVVEADTDTTAIVNIISKSYSMADALQFTEQHKFRITTTGSITPVLIDIQQAAGSKNHLVFTY